MDDFDSFVSMIQFLITVVLVVTFFYVAYILTKISDTLNSISHLINFHAEAIGKGVTSKSAADRKPPPMPHG